MKKLYIGDISSSTRHAFLAAIAVLALASHASAQSQLNYDTSATTGIQNGSSTWDTGTTSSWNTGTGAGVTTWTADDFAVFAAPASGVSTANTLTIGSGVTIDVSAPSSGSKTGINVTSSLSPTTINGGTIQFDGASGTTFAEATAGNLTINSNVTFSQAGSIFLAGTATSTVTVNGSITGAAGSILRVNNGTTGVVLSGADTFGTGGGILLNAGSTLTATQGSSLGNTYVAFHANASTAPSTLILNFASNSTSTNTWEFDPSGYASVGTTGYVAIDSIGAGGANLSSTAAIAFGAPTGANSVGPLVINFGGASTSTNNIFAGKITNDSTYAVSIVKSGAGTWALTGANTYSGGVTITGGTLSFATIAASGSAQPLGVSTNVTLAGANAAAGATLQYTGASANLGQGVTVSSGDVGTITNSGSGVLTLSGLLYNDGSVLNFGGGKMVETGGIYGVSAGTAVNVTGGAAVGLTTNNAYTAPTSISGGSTLLTGVSDALPDANTGGSTALTLGASGDTGVNTLDLLGTSQTVTSLTVASGSGATNRVISSNGSASTATVGTGASSTTGTLNVDLVSGTDTYSGSLGGTSVNNFAVAVSGTGTLALSNAAGNTYTGGTSVGASNTLLLSNTSGSAAGTGSLTVGGGATVGGTGSYGSTSAPGAGFVISGTGTTPTTRANVLVGMNSSSDTSTITTLGLIASTGSISNANLTFNISIGTHGALGSNPSGSGTELSVGATNVTFGSGVQLTLNVQGEPGIIPNATAYVLLAGTGITNTGGVTTSGQYAGLTLGKVLESGGGITETVINSSSLNLAFGATLDQQYYGNSYLVLYQNTNGSTNVDDIDVVVVPEPSTWALILGGGILLVVIQRRKNRQG